MNSRKEMMPALTREVHKSAAFCQPEWDLLCLIRKDLKEIVNQPLRGKTAQSTVNIALKIGEIIQTMNNVFDDWPEDPK